MKKAHKRTHSGWMRRVVRVYLPHLNQGKARQLSTFLRQYCNVVNYFIIRFWSQKDFSSNLANYTVIAKAVRRFGITARIAQCAAKQAKEIVVGQRRRWGKNARMPRFRSLIANLDSRFVKISPFIGKFDLALEFVSGVPNMVVPVMLPFAMKSPNSRSILRRYLTDGWELSRSIRLVERDGKIGVDLIYEKEKPAPRPCGEILAIDAGLNRLYTAVSNTGEVQEIGNDFKEIVKRGGKRRKTWHHFVKTEINRLIKTIDLRNVATVLIEDLKYVKHNKRGKFSRNTNRLLSFWAYAHGRKRITQRCEEAGSKVVALNPAYTSQRCPVCGNIDRRNRRGVAFRCTSCGHADDSDRIGARNLLALRLAGVWSVKQLPTIHSPRSLQNATSVLEDVA